MKSSTLAACVVFLAHSPTTLAFMYGDRYPQSHHGLINQQQTVTKCKELNLYRSAQEAIAEAERICAEEGPYSERCKVAWDIVEELEAADSHDRKPQATGSHELSYSPLVNGLDILSSKIERKMDELKKLSTELAEAGAGPEVERLVYASDEMKQIIQEANRSLDVYR